jgi:hypothetical protein
LFSGCYLNEDNSQEGDGTNIRLHTWRRLEMYTIFFLVSFNGRQNSGDLGIFKRIILKWIFRKYGRKL